MESFEIIFVISALLLFATCIIVILMKEGLIELPCNQESSPNTMIHASEVPKQEPADVTMSIQERASVFDDITNSPGQTENWAPEPPRPRTEPRSPTSNTDCRE